MLMEGKLNIYLADSDKQAQEMYLRLVSALAKQNSVTEKLKAENPFEWVRQMNACKAQAEKVVLSELVCD